MLISEVLGRSKLCIDDKESFHLPFAAPTKETNGYLRVRCNGGLNQQRSAVGV